MKRVTPRRGKPGPRFKPIDLDGIDASIEDAAQIVEHREEALQAPILEELPTPQPPPKNGL